MLACSRLATEGNFRMNQKDKRRLENELIVMGLPRLNDPNLIQAMADMVSNWHGDRHEFLRDLLNECDAEKRSEMYNAIAPKLNFKPLSLYQYEMQIAEQAGRMVSQRRMRVEGSAPRTVEIGGHKLAVVPKPLATGAVATLSCHRCNRKEHFKADTPAGAMIEGRKAGWVREPGVNKECCPECYAGVAQKTKIEKIVMRGEEITIVDRRTVN
jgi:hypothetical protein